MTENYANFFVSVLAVALDSTTSPVDVEIASGDGDDAPTAYPFRFTVDREVFLCNGPVTVDTLENCSRAQEGSVMATHNPGAYVRHGLTAGQAGYLRGSGTTGNRPTGMVTGSMYFDTTLGKPVWWNGSVWKDAAGSTV